VLCKKYLANKQLQRGVERPLRASTSINKDRIDVSCQPCIANLPSSLQNNEETGKSAIEVRKWVQDGKRAVKARRQKISSGRRAAEV